MKSNHYSNAGEHSKLPTQQEVIHKNTPGFRVNSGAKFANTNQEHLDLLRKVFKNYVVHEMEHEKDEVKILMKVFDMQIDADNIRNYMGRTCSELYVAIINDKLSSISNYTKA